MFLFQTGPTRLKSPRKTWQNQLFPDFLTVAKIRQFGQNIHRCINLTNRKFTCSSHNSTSLLQFWATRSSVEVVRRYGYVVSSCLPQLHIFVAVLSNTFIGWSRSSLWLRRVIVSIAWYNWPVKKSNTRGIWSRVISSVLSKCGRSSWMYETWRIKETLFSYFDTWRNQDI